MTIYRARIEFLPSCHIMYKNKNNIHVRFASAQPHSLQLSGGKNDLFSPSPLRGSGRKCHFCLPQAEVNSVVPRQNERECYIYVLYFILLSAYVSDFFRCKQLRTYLIGCGDFGTEGNHYFHKLNFISHRGIHQRSVTRSRIHHV